MQMRIPAICEMWYRTRRKRKEIITTIAIAQKLISDVLSMVVYWKESTIK